MKTILGIVASARPWGNSEVVIREALAGAMEAGAVEPLPLPGSPAGKV